MNRDLSTWCAERWRKSESAHWTPSDGMIWLWLFRLINLDCGLCDSSYIHPRGEVISERSYFFNGYKRRDRTATLGFQIWCPGFGRCIWMVAEHSGHIQCILFYWTIFGLFFFPFWDYIDTNKIHTIWPKVTITSATCLQFVKTSKWLDSGIFSAGNCQYYRIHNHFRELCSSDPMITIWGNPFFCSGNTVSLCIETSRWTHGLN